MEKPEIVNAAVAVLLRDDGQVLLGQRPQGKPWGGWWEFPGGKIEQGESPYHALQRELQEELGTKAIEAYPWLTRSFDYPERKVKLHFFIVRRWTDAPHGREGQLLSWQNPAALTVDPMLPANAPILSALLLPTTYAITNLAETAEMLFIARLEKALANGLRLIQVREKHLSKTELQTFARNVIALAKPYAARVLINADIELADSVGADGVHLTAASLMAMQAKPQGLLCGASCHDVIELEHAANLGLDFVLLSPVMSTCSHPDIVALGWREFSRLIQNYPLPVYALGGLQPQNMVSAWRHGAHGIAMQRAVWEG